MRAVGDGGAKGVGANPTPLPMFAPPVALGILICGGINGGGEGGCTTITCLAGGGTGAVGGGIGAGGVGRV